MVQTAIDKWVDIGDLSFHYRDWGDSGYPIILLHGLASNSHWWDLVAPRLAEDFAVVALDQRGHGESAKPEYGYDFATVAADLHGFVQALQLDNPILVGHSWGGDVALEYAVANSGSARGLCFVDGGMIEIASREGATLEQAKIDMAPPVWDGMTVDGLRERSKRWRANSASVANFEEILLSNFEVGEDNSIHARLSRDNHIRIIEALWEHFPSKLFSRVDCPVLIMPARQQVDDSQQSRRFRREESVASAAALLPVSKTVWLEDSIHDVPIQRPQLVADVIRKHIQGGFFG